MQFRTKKREEGGYIVQGKVNPWSIVGSVRVERWDTGWIAQAEFGDEAIRTRMATKRKAVHQAHQMLLDEHQRVKEQRELRSINVHELVEGEPVPYEPIPDRRTNQ